MEKSWDKWGTICFGTEMSIILLEGSKASPARASDKCVEVKTSQCLEAVTWDKGYGFFLN
jgi:hypothetical protein